MRGPANWKAGRSRSDVRGLRSERRGRSGERGYGQPQPHASATSAISFRKTAATWRTGGAVAWMFGGPRARSLPGRQGHRGPGHRTSCWTRRGTTCGGRRALGNPLGAEKLTTAVLKALEAERAAPRRSVHRDGSEERHQAGRQERRFDDAVERSAGRARRRPGRITLNSTSTTRSWRRWRSRVRVLGIDCGSERTGYGVIGSRWTGTPDGGRRGDSDESEMAVREAAARIAQGLRRLIAEFAPEAAGVEGYSFREREDRVETGAREGSGAVDGRGSRHRGGGILAARNQDERGGLWPGR